MQKQSPFGYAPGAAYLRLLEAKIENKNETDSRSMDFKKEESICLAPKGGNTAQTKTGLRKNAGTLPESRQITKAGSLKIAKYKKMKQP